MLKVIYGDRGWMLEIHWFDCLSSTQNYLEEAIRNKKLFPPVTIATENQTSGIGSRGNEWEGCRGNLFFSTAIYEKDLPEDLLLESASIYFGFLMKEVLNGLDSNVWMKWPNDLYSHEKKLGGVITKKLGNIIICGIGVNTHSAPPNFGILDSEMPNLWVLESFLEKLQMGYSWKEIFRKFAVEFEFNKSKNFPHTSGVNLQQATLLNDGSLDIDGTKVYSLR